MRLLKFILLGTGITLPATRLTYPVHEKALTEMSLHLHNVLSNVAGVTGMNVIIRAIIARELSPERLALMREQGLKNTHEAVVKAIEGDDWQEHLVALKQAVGSIIIITTR
jgi:hypothetical protein